MFLWSFLVHFCHGLAFSFCLGATISSIPGKEERRRAHGLFAIDWELGMDLFRCFSLLENSCSYLDLAAALTFWLQSGMWIISFQLIIFSFFFFWSFLCWSESRDLIWAIFIFGNGLDIYMQVYVSHSNFSRFTCYQWVMNIWYIKIWYWSKMHCCMCFSM